MKEEINLNQSSIALLAPQKETSEGKKWSYSFVYYLEDLRNIYRIYDNYYIESISALLDKCLELGLKSWSGKEWNHRNLLELVNALKNFKLLSLDGSSVLKKGLFNTTNPESPLSAEEQIVFKRVYLSYFRFREFHQLFESGKKMINEKVLVKNSSPIIYYMEGSRFTNRFLQRKESKPVIMEIDTNHADMMRFWDVYIKWGTSLKMLQKYPLKPFGITTIPAVKGLSIAFFQQRMPNDFSVFDYITREMQGSYFYIPDVLYDIMVEFRYSVEEILQRITEESATKPDVFRVQSTSEIFINDREKFLFPKIGKTYITHLLKI